jgi:subtilase-type serine protease
MAGGRMCDFGGLGQSVAVGNGSNVLAECPWGIWGRGYGLFGERENERDAPGYDYQMGAGAVGLDYQFTGKFLAGVVFGYTDGSVDFSGMRDNADLRAIHAALYGNLTWDKWYLNSTLAYGNVHYDTNRFVALTGEHLRGDLNGNDWTAYFEAGENVSVTPTVLLQPFVSLQYSFLDLGSYTETGGISALSYRSQDYQSVKGGFGARLTGRLCECESGFRMDGQVRARWLHEFGDNQSQVDTAFASNPATVFTIHDAEIARDSAVLGVGVSAKITRQLRASADYDALLNTDETVQLVSAGLEYRW